ncbi:MAG: hypothetical protein ACR2I2_17530 [Bryobacteraceae bacterium]
MPERADGIGELFDERNLWQLYRQGKAIYHNPFNRIALIVAGILLAGFGIVHFFHLGSTRSNRLDFPALFSTWATNGIAYGATILGFLLAGFVVLFAVLRPHTVIALQQITRPGERLHELKLIMVTFVDVFVHYTTFLGWCIVYMIAGGENGPFDLLGSYLSVISASVPTAVTHLVFIAWGLWFLILVLKLKGFIYNLYQTLLLGMADSLSE